MDGVEDESLKQALDTSIAFTIVSTFVKRHEVRVDQFDKELKQLVDQFNKSKAVESKKFHEELLKRNVAAEIAQDAVVKFNSASTCPVSYPKSRPGYYQDLSTQVSEDAPDLPNILSTVSSSKTTTSQLRTELVDESLRSTHAGPRETAAGEEESTIFVREEQNREGQNLQKGHISPDDSPIIPENPTLPRDRTPSIDRPLTTYQFSNERTIHDSILPSSEYAFINLEVPDNVYVLRCPEGACNTQHFEKNPFRYSRALNHFIKHHKEVFKGVEPSERFIFWNYSLKVLGVKVNENWVAQRSKSTKYKCDLSQAIPKRNHRKQAKATKRGKQPRSECDSALPSNPPSPVLGSVEQGHKRSDGYLGDDVRRSSRSVPNCTYQEFTEQSDLDPFEDCDMSSGSEADHHVNESYDDYSRGQLDDPVSNNRDSATNTTPEPGLNTTRPTSFKRARVSSEEEEETEHLTVKLKYNTNRFDATQKNDNSTTEDNPFDPFESAESMSGGCAQGIHDLCSHGRSEEDRVRLDRGKFTDPFPRRSAPS